ncbi:MAG: NAD(+)/NADH kinase [Muribaculaceae bacterium]|nr:NAD(+)/NADH kinase [Muribaculaceae bacterium]
MRIAIYGSRRQHDSLAEVSAFLSDASRRGIELTIHRKLFKHLREEMPAFMSGIACRVVDELGDSVADYAVSLGGDGTFLRTAAWVGSRMIPIIGVNTGHLGYLAALDIADLPLLPEVLGRASETFRIEHRSLIEVECEAVREKGLWPYALNEVAVMKEESASMIVAETWIGDESLAEYRADGLIVCTPTGSTAYNLSVGGPLVDPELDVHVISPIACHSLAMRPLVVGSRRPLRILPGGRAPFVRLAIDGRSVPVANGEEIVLRRAPFPTLVAQLRSRTFTDTLRHKLHWADEA